MKLLSIFLKATTFVLFVAIFVSCEENDENTMTVEQYENATGIVLDIKSCENKICTNMTPEDSSFQFSFYGEYIGNRIFYIATGQISDTVVRLSNIPSSLFTEDSPEFVYFSADNYHEKGFYVNREEKRTPDWMEFYIKLLEACVTHSTWEVEDDFVYSMSDGDSASRAEIQVKTIGCEDNSCVRPSDFILHGDQPHSICTDGTCTK